MQDRILRSVKIHSNWLDGCAICGGTDGRLELMSPVREKEPRKSYWSVHKQCFEAELAKQNGEAA